MTPKQQRFCEEYLVDLNASQAAQRAGYQAKNLAVCASKLLIKPNIQAAIQEAMDARSQRTEITQDRVLRELALIAFADMREYVEWGPDGIELIKSADLLEEASRVVAEVSQTVTKDGGTIKFKLHDKKVALELLGRHLNIFGDVGTPVVPMQVNFTIGKGYDDPVENAPLVDGSGQVVG